MKTELFIDPRLHYCGTSKLREMDSEFLRELGEEVYVIQSGTAPLAVLVSYEMYLQICAELKSKGAL